METIEKTIEVDAPLTTVYNQWTQFEEFPRFMEGVKEVRQIDDTHLHWKAEIAGKEKEWNAEIVRQVPDQVVAWPSSRPRTMRPPSLFRNARHAFAKSAASLGISKKWI